MIMRKFLCVLMKFMAKFSFKDIVNRFATNNSSRYCKSPELVVCVSFSILQFHPKLFSYSHYINKYVFLFLFLFFYLCFIICLFTLYTQLSLLYELLRIFTTHQNHSSINFCSFCLIFVILVWTFHSRSRRIFRLFIIIRSFCL